MIRLAGAEPEPIKVLGKHCGRGHGDATVMLAKAGGASSRRALGVMPKLLGFVLYAMRAINDPVCCVD